MDLLISLCTLLINKRILTRFFAASIMFSISGCLTFNQRAYERHQIEIRKENSNILHSDGVCVAAMKKSEKHVPCIILRKNMAYVSNNEEFVLNIFSKFPLCLELYIYDPNRRDFECWSFDPSGSLVHFYSNMAIRDFEILYSAKSIDALATRNREVHKKELLQNF